MSRLKYVCHCLCNALFVYCRGRAVTNVGKTCGPTPCFVLAIKTFKLNTTPVSLLMNESPVDVRRVLHGQMSLAAVNQIRVIHGAMNGSEY